jgi:chromosome segregation ATPase
MHWIIVAAIAGGMGFGGSAGRQWVTGEHYATQSALDSAVTQIRAEIRELDQRGSRECMVVKAQLAEHQRAGEELLREMRAMREAIGKLREDVASLLTRANGGPSGGR